MHLSIVIGANVSTISNGRKNLKFKKKKKLKFNILQKGIKFWEHLRK